MKRFKYISIALVLLVLDIGLTIYFLNFSETAVEGNPLFQIDGGYLALVVNFMYILTVFLLELLVLNKYETIVLEVNSFNSYVKKLIKNDNFSYILASFSFAYIISTITSRLMAIIDWIIFGIYGNDFYQLAYTNLRKKMPLGRYDVVVAVIVFVVSLVVWYRLEYLKSKKLIDKTQ